MCMIVKKMYMICTILSPNCCGSAVTICEYSSTDATLLPSRLQVLCEHVASQNKWQSADRPPKTSEEEEKCVASAIPR